MAQVLPVLYSPASPLAMSDPGTPKRLLFRLPLERILILATVALGLIHSWVNRYAMNPDGISYLDLGQSFFHREWANALSAYWSPLYPWALGTLLGVANPSPRWEFPLVQAGNFVIFVVTIFAFRFFLHQLMIFYRHSTPEGTSDDEDVLPEWSVILVAYAMFWWVALEIETLYDVSPDMAVVACLCFAAGMLLSLRSDRRLRKFALFGLILGIGYWTKAILFPIGFVILAAALWWKRSERPWRFGIVVACVTFLCTSAPLIISLSQQKGRATFGDSGRLAYAWCVSPKTNWRNWQGEESGSGTPVHPTRQLLAHPPLFEFDGPVVGTYPPWTDPSYWNEGLKPRFRLRPQVEVIATGLASELRLLTRSQPALVVGIFVFAFLGGRRWWRNLREVWPLIAVSTAGMGLYLLVLENDRYLGGFLLLLFLPLITGAQGSSEGKRNLFYVSVAVFFAMLLGTADYTVRIVTNHMAIPGNGPASAWPDVVAAEQLSDMGTRPGDKVAVIGDGTGAYWAHLAKLRIVAEIMGANHGSREFWNASEEEKQNVYNTFARAHAKLVVTACPLSQAKTSTGWQPVAETALCARSLQLP